MTKEQILKSLTPSQIEELNENIKEIEMTLYSTNNIYKYKLHEINVNIRLENVVFLNMTLGFVLNPHGKLVGEILDLIKFNNSDEYLDSINKAHGLKDNWKTLK